MSKGEILYTKGMNISESENDDEEDVWDDRKINEAYDKAMKIASAEVAKRVAMSTNTSSNKEVSASAGSKSKKYTPKSSKSSSSSKAKVKPWKAGKPCRAPYEGDGNEYEAIILRIINNDECVVRFLGYDDSEIVPLDSLKPSLGETEQARQLEEALNEELEDEQLDEAREKMECSTERPNSSGSTERSYSSKKKHLSRKKQNHKSTNMFSFPEMSLPPMPNLSMMKNLGGFSLPPPPPPCALPAAGAEDAALSSMLLSWYMSGYYTGLYQGMKRAKENRRH